MGESKPRRVLRVEREIRDIIARYLISGFKYPLPSFVSVVCVNATRDLRLARVTISVLESCEAEEKMVKILNMHTHDFQAQISRSLNMKFCPKVSFYPDKSSIIEEKFHQIRMERLGAENTGDPS